MSNEVAVALIGGVVSLASLAMTLLVKRNQSRLHKQINSRMDELLALTKEAGNREGRADLKQEQKADGSAGSTQDNGAV